MTVNNKVVKGKAKTGANEINGIRYLYIGGYDKEAKNVPVIIFRVF